MRDLPLETASGIPEIDVALQVQPELWSIAEELAERALEETAAAEMAIADWRNED